MAKLGQKFSGRDPDRRSIREIKRQEFLESQGIAPTRDTTAVDPDPMLMLGKVIDGLSKSAAADPENARFLEMVKFGMAIHSLGKPVFPVTSLGRPNSKSQSFKAMEQFFRLRGFR